MAAAATQARPTSGTVTAKTTSSSTNIRSAANLRAGVVKRVPAGTSLTGTLSNGWIHITSPAAYNGKYVSFSVLTYVPATTSKPAPTPTKPAPTKPTPAPVYRLNAPFACTTNPTLPTSRNAACTQAAQYVLNSWMIRTNPAGAQLLTVNGTYGAVTTADVKLFQKSNGITQSGKVDSATWKALAAASSTTASRTSGQIIGAAGDTHPAFPSTIKLKDGRLMLVFTSAKQHRNNTTPSTTWKTYSSDGGYTWSTPQQITLPNGMENTPAGLGIATTGPLAGRPILTTWSVEKSGMRHTMVTIATDDGGSSWGPLTDVRAVQGTNLSASPIVQVDDTNFQQAVYVWASSGSWGARTVGLTYDGTRFVIGSVAVIATAAQQASTDTPSSTQSPVSTDKTNSVKTSGGFTEVGMIKLPDGRLLALVRNDTTVAPGTKPTPADNAGIWASWSSDGGKTWTLATRSFDGSGVPRIGLTTDGKLVVLYRKFAGDGDSGASQTGKMDAVYRVSIDGGRSWGAETSVGTHSAFEMAYGTPIANADGTITFVFASETAGTQSGMVTTPNVPVKR